MKTATLMITALLVFGCGGDGGNGGDDAEPYPADCEVEPNWASLETKYFGFSCAFSSCHSSTTNAGDLNLEEGIAYKNLVNVDAADPKAVEASKVRVVPGDSAGSFLYQKLAGTFGDGEGVIMPQGQTEPFEPDCRLRAVREWIDNGATQE